jgi:tetratricopeptide (TPR) repeat protein
MCGLHAKLSATFPKMNIRLLIVGVRLGLASLCFLGIWESWQFLRADELSWEGTADSIRAAIRLEPDSWWYYMQLARLDDKDAEQLLQTSLMHNPYNSDAAIELGLRYEADGDFPRAEKLLLQAFGVDHTYAPRWSLANFYFRRDNLPSFWIWARRAAEMPANDISALFELCWRVSSDPKTIEANIVVDNPSVIRQYVDFLMSKDQVRAAVYPALRLVRSGSSQDDRERLFDLTDRVIEANDAAGADLLWRELIRQHWIVADSSIPNNPEFARAPLPMRFDWNLPGDDGFHSWPGSQGLVTEFTGDEPESLTIAEQAILLPPGNYKLESSYHTRNIAADTGIRWEITWIGSDSLVTSSRFLSSDMPAKCTLPFSVDTDHRLLRLRLVYRRQIGTPRVSGTLVVPSIRIQALPST